MFARVLPILLVLCAVTGVLMVTIVQASATAVSPEEAKSWCHYLVPMPKSVEIPSKVVMDAVRVEIIKPAASDILIDQAAKELGETIGCGTVAGARDYAPFKIEMVLGGAEADKLKSLKNSDQAYSIAPTGENGLKLTAITSRGLYYASKTLQQLLKPRVSEGKVEIPLLKVTDWPDLDERGLWGGDSAFYLDWMADRKMNVTENISSRSVTRDGRGKSEPKSYWENAPEEGPARAIKVVPAVLHLEFVSGPYMDDKGEYTLFDVYPSLKAVDGAHGGVICYASGEFVNVLADWIVDLKNIPNVTEVSVWLAENLQGKGGCKCETCKKEDRNLQEYRTVMAAYKKAQERVGKFGLRILTSEETRSSLKPLMAELPLDVRLLYYDSLFTYTTGKEPMVDPEIKKFIDRGGWVSVVPNLSAFVRLINPFSSPYFSHYRLNDFVDEGCSGLLGYACYGLINSRFLVEGGAEWAWNAKGRSPEEFAYSWAVRQGIKDPARFVEWNKLHAPVAWDVYGSDFPAKNPSQANRGGLAHTLRSGNIPALGTVRGPWRGPWGQIKTIEQFDANLRDSDKALKMAREMGLPEFYYETIVVNGYIKAMRSGYDLAQLISKGKIIPGKEQQAAKLAKDYISHLKQSADALPRWLQAISGGPLPTEVGSVEALNQCIEGMEKYAADMGLKLK